MIIGIATLGLLTLYSAAGGSMNPWALKQAVIFLGFLMVAIGMSFGKLHGYAINPARDIGPRIFTVMAGFRNNGLTDNTGIWWIPIVAPLAGGLVGGGCYDLLIRRWLPRD